MHEANCIHNDIFFLHHVNSLAYQALVPAKFERLFRTSKPVDISPEVESECNHILKQAEVAIRKENDNILVSVSSSCRVLWVYKLLEPETETQTITAEDILPLTTNDLKVISSDTVKGLNVHIGPFLRAVNQYMLGSLIKMRSDSEYEFFGDNYILNTKNGSLIASSIEIQSDASIYARAYTFRTNLHIPPVHKGCPPSQHVVLLPIGCSAMVSKNSDGEMVVLEPCRQRAEIIYKEMNRYFITNIELTTLERSSWLKLKTAHNNEFFWPLELIRSNAVHEGRSEHSLNNKLAFNYSLKSGTNAYKHMAQAMQDLMAPFDSDSPELPRPSLYKTVYPPLGPPPSPSASISCPGEPVSANSTSTTSAGTGTGTGNVGDAIGNAIGNTGSAIGGPLSSPVSRPISGADPIGGIVSSPIGSTGPIGTAPIGTGPIGSIGGSDGPSKRIKLNSTDYRSPQNLFKYVDNSFETENNPMETQDACHVVFCNCKPWTLFYVKPSLDEQTEFNALKLLLPQIIWDFGHMDAITTDHNYRYKVSVPSPYIIRQFKKLFPEFKETNIDSLLPSSGVAPKLQLLSPPLVSVNQENEHIKARIPILKFWKYLNLRPIKKPFQLVVIALTINLPPVLFAFRNILHGIRDSYRKCGLGEIVLPSLKNVVEGIMPVSINMRTMTVTQISAAFELCFNELLVSLKDKFGCDTKILIITGYPFKLAVQSDAFRTSVFALANGFGKIKSTFHFAEWISLGLSTVLTESNDLSLGEHNFTKLALSAYGRFKPFFALSSLIPHSAGLQYNKDPPVYLLEEEPFLYVSYLTVNHRICLVSLTDQLAVVKRVEIIQNFDENGLIQFNKLISSIWKVAKSVADDDPIKKYRFVFLKCGIMRLEERNMWRQVRQSGTDFLVLDVPHLTGLKVTSDHDLVRSASKSSSPNSASSLSGLANGSGSNSASTSTSTSTSTPSDTPSDTPPPDSIIIDKNDEVYGTSINGPEGYLSSGFLIKPEDEFYTVFEIRLLMTSRRGPIPRSMINKILGQFRRLASMSQATGVTSSPSLIPWNIIALAKIASALKNLDIS